MRLQCKFASVAPAARGSTWPVRSRPYQLCLTVSCWENESLFFSLLQILHFLPLCKFKTFYCFMTQDFVFAASVRSYVSLMGFRHWSPGHERELCITHTVLGWVWYFRRQIFLSGDKFSVTCLKLQARPNRRWLRLCSGRMLYLYWQWCKCGRPRTWTAAIVRRMCSGNKGSGCVILKLIRMTHLLFNQFMSPKEIKNLFTITPVCY